MTRPVQLLLLAILIVVIPSLYMQGYETSQTPQARYNNAVLNSDSLKKGLEHYPTYWPPLYPTTLWSINKSTGLSAYAVNILCFSLSLLLVAIFARQHICRGMHEGLYLVPVALLALNNIFYYNASVITSETMLVALSLLLLILLARHIEKPNISGAVLLGLLTGTICFTRYFGALWVFATTAACLLLIAEPLRQKFRHILVYGLVTACTSAIWLVQVWQRTGHLTGMDRTEQRVIPDKFGSLAQFTSLADNLSATLRTATYDLLSPSHIGDYLSLFTQQYTASEILLSSVLLCVFTLVVVEAAKAAGPKAEPPALTPARLPAIFSVSYIVLIILVWSVGNNDPIYTRFIVPSYPFFLLAVFALFIDSARQASGRRPVRYFLLACTVIYVGNLLLEAASLAADATL